MSEVVIRGLEPGATYRVQLRAKNGAIVSEWSQLFVFTTDIDTIPPADVQGLVWEVEGTAFRGVWTAVSTNEDGSPIADFKDYEVTIYSPADPSNRVTYYTASNRFDLTFEENVNAFGTPRAQVNIEVRARDNTGNLSTNTATASATNPPPSDVPSINATGLSDAISITWGEVPDTDLDHYEVYMSTVGPDFVPALSNRKWAGKGTSFVFDAISDTTWYIKAGAVDVFGTMSQGFPSTSAAAHSTMTVDTTPPANVTGVTVTKNGGQPKVTWTGVADTDLQNYTVRYSTSSTGPWTYVDIPRDTSPLEYVITNAKEGASYYIGVATVDYSGNSSGTYVTDAANYPITTDVAALPTPPAPTATAGTTKIQVVVDSTGMPATVQYYKVYASTTTGFTPSDTTLLSKERADYISSGPAMVATYAIPASAASGSTQTWYVKVIAGKVVGGTEVLSSASPQATAAVGLIDTTNIADAAITNAKIHDLAVDKLTAGTGIVNNLSIKSTLMVDTNGILKSSNYSAGSAGYQLTNTSLEINQGSIAAKTLLLQNGANMVPAAYADFEYTPSWYSATTVQATHDGGTETFAIAYSPEVTPKFNSQCLKVTRTASAGTYSQFGFSTTATDYNIPLEQGSDYIYSVYVFNPSGGSAVTLGFSIGAATAITPTTATVSVPANGTWTRYSTTFNAGTNPAAWVAVRLNTAGTIYIDGVQVEPKIGALTTPSQWKPPSMTRIDGGIIRTGEIRSTASADGVSGQPAWAINVSGTAQFGNAIVRGSLYVGDPVTPSSDTVSKIQSTNFATGASGWKIDASGNAEFNNGVWRGNLGANTVTANAIQSGAVTADKVGTGTLYANVTLSGSIKTGTTGARVEIDSAGIRQYASGGTLSVNLYTSGAYAYFQGDITARTFRSQGYSTGSIAYIEIGNTGTSDPVDEVRMFYGSSYISSIRNPSDRPGIMRVSTSEGGTTYTYEFGRYGIETNRIGGRGSYATSTFMTLDSNGVTMFTPNYTGALRFICQSTDGHPFYYATAGGTGIKMLTSVAQLQARSAADTAYGSVKADTYYYVSAAPQSSSSRRFKRNITSYKFDYDKFLNLDLKRYQYTPEFLKGEGADPTESTRWHVGLLAEDVAAAGLENLVSFDDAGNPTHLSVLELGLYLLPIVREQRDRIAALEAKVDTLSKVGKP